MLKYEMNSIEINEFRDALDNIKVWIEEIKKEYPDFVKEREDSYGGIHTLDYDNRAFGSLLYNIRKLYEIRDRM